MWRASASIMPRVCSAVAIVMRCRGVDHDDAALGGGVDVDVVDADAGAADDDEVLGRFEHFSGDFGLAAHRQGFVVRDDVE